MWVGVAVPFMVAMQLLPDFLPKRQFVLMIVAMVALNLATMHHENIASMVHVDFDDSSAPKLRYVETMNGWFFCTTLFTLKLQFLSRQVWFAKIKSESDV